MKEHTIEYLTLNYFNSYSLNNKSIYNYIYNYNNSFIYYNASHLFNDISNLWLLLLDAKWLNDK